MSIRDWERKIVAGSRYLSVAAVVGSMAGAVLMFFLGLYNIYRAFAVGLHLPEDAEAEETTFGAEAVISVIEGLDRFLIAIVLLYFSYGVYSLFLHPEESEAQLSLPQWLKVKQIGQLKQVVAEVIIVVILVLFLRVALQAFDRAHTTLEPMQIATLAVLPVSVLFLALALRLVQLHPKPAGDKEEAADIAARDNTAETAAGGRPMDD